MNRRIADLEEELGAPLFERRPRGVRLTAAGEVFVNYLRQQDGEVERMKSQIEDLKGMRRGTVRIACSQALALEFLPRQIGESSKRNPQAAFDVRCSTTSRPCWRSPATRSTSVLVFRPPFLANFQPLMIARAARGRRDVVGASAGSASARWAARLRGLSGGAAGAQHRRRQLLEEVMARSRISFKLAAESNSFETVARAGREAGLISFQIRIGTYADRQQARLVARDIDDRDAARQPGARPVSQPYSADLWRQCSPSDWPARWRRCASDNQPIDTAYFSRHSATQNRQRPCKPQNAPRFLHGMALAARRHQQTWLTR